MQLLQHLLLSIPLDLLQPTSYHLDDACMRRLHVVRITLTEAVREVAVVCPIREVDDKEVPSWEKILVEASHRPAVVEAVGPDDARCEGLDTLLGEAPELVQSIRLRGRPEATFAMVLQP
eukprot:CAMPEP_0195028180 /NCGR_PEP_ID=MMETSP0326_2-20130528/53879_1 /TAXON_ID=2866 ORGANISM="Crypthecodinium cohnii, Strain Seligo" /NCGR_SAMPLE_ID=MMETSP0326_2 /ASSEMBLY_ACC=CAM_ASM_000348 /LENGTH=119 /DNA_ID=CAMNT_0040050617 /DNA_START=563 /DNA_END=922 /DNA_ORIENTATION=+